MAQDKPPQDLMHYEHLMQEAARGVVRAALKRAATPAGPPGDHHFYITFKTGAPGVSGPPDILAAYPDEMSIILQHEFWDLAPGETFFSVTLKFSGPGETAVDPVHGGDPVHRSERAVRTCNSSRPKTEADRRLARARARRQTGAGRKQTPSVRPLRRAQSGLARPVQKEVTP